MALVLSITEVDVMTVLRTFLLAVLPNGTEVVRGLDNRVPEVKAQNFVVATTIIRDRLATNQVAYSDLPGDGQRSEMQETEITVQLDIHGPLSGDNAQIIATLLRDDYACRAMAAAGFDIQPLYAGDPRLVPFINAENQYEDRWVVDAVLQMNPVVSTVQDFADTAVVGLISVDAKYPPT